MQMEVMMHKCPHKNFEGDLPFRGEAQNCETVKFLLVSPTYERGLELSLIRLRSPLNLGGVVVLQSLLPFMQCCNSKLISWISKFFPLLSQILEQSFSRNIPYGADVIASAPKSLVSQGI